MLERAEVADERFSFKRKLNSKAKAEAKAKEWIVQF